MFVNILSILVKVGQIFPGWGTASRSFRCSKGLGLGDHFQVHKVSQGTCTVLRTYLPTIRYGVSSTKRSPKYSILDKAHKYYIYTYFANVCIHILYIYVYIIVSSVFNIYIYVWHIYIYICVSLGNIHSAHVYM